MEDLILSARRRLLSAQGVELVKEPGSLPCASAVVNRVIHQPTVESRAQCGTEPYAAASAWSVRSGRDGRSALGHRDVNANVVAAAAAVSELLQSTQAEVVVQRSLAPDAVPPPAVDRCLAREGDRTDRRVGHGVEGVDREGVMLCRTMNSEAPDRPATLRPRGGVDDRSLARHAAPVEADGSRRVWPSGRDADGATADHPFFVVGGDVTGEEAGSDHRVVLSHLQSRVLQGARPKAAAPPTTLCGVYFTPELVELSPNPLRVTSSAGEAAPARNGAPPVRDPTPSALAGPDFERHGVAWGSSPGVVSVAADDAVAVGDCDDEVGAFRAFRERLMKKVVATTAADRTGAATGCRPHPLEVPAASVAEKAAAGTVCEPQRTRDRGCGGTPPPSPPPHAPAAVWRDPGPLTGTSGGLGPIDLAEAVPPRAGVGEAGTRTSGNRVRPTSAAHLESEAWDCPSQSRSRDTRSSRGTAAFAGSRHGTPYTPRSAKASASASRFTASASPQAASPGGPSPTVEGQSSRRGRVPPSQAAPASGDFFVHELRQRRSLSVPHSHGHGGVAARLGGRPAQASTACKPRALGPPPRSTSREPSPREPQHSATLRLARRSESASESRAATSRSRADTMERGSVTSSMRPEAGESGVEGGTSLAQAVVSGAELFALLRMRGMITSSGSTGEELLPRHPCHSLLVTAEEWKQLRHLRQLLSQSPLLADASGRRGNSHRCHPAAKPAAVAAGGNGRTGGPPSSVGERRSTSNSSTALGATSRPAARRRSPRPAVSRPPVQPPPQAMAAHSSRVSNPSNTRPRSRLR